MNIIDIVKNLYVNKNSKWLKNINEDEIQPYVIQRWLAMNDMIRMQTRWLDKYVFVLPPKMYLSLAWSVIPKVRNPPFCEYIKKRDETEEFDFILKKIRKHFEMSDNCFQCNKSRILTEIKKDMGSWFRYYGIPKRYWKTYCLDFSKIKFIEEKKEIKNLGEWGL